MPSLNTRIQTNYGLYTTAEKKIAEALLNFPDKLKQLSIQDLAKFCKVSTSTITRFCYKTGYSSFMELRLAIESSEFEVTNSDSFVSKVETYYQKNIHHSIELLDIEKIETLTNEIKKSKVIYLWGLGSSGRTSSEFEQTLTRMGILVKAITDPHMLLLTAPQITKNDMVLIISISGKSKEILHAIELLPENSHIVALTSDPNSQIAEKADYMLQISDIRINNNYFVNFQLSLIFTIDCIAESLLTDKKLQKHFNKTVTLLSSN